MSQPSLWKSTAWVKSHIAAFELENKSRRRRRVHLPAHDHPWRRRRRRRRRRHSSSLRRRRTAAWCVAIASPRTADFYGLYTSRTASRTSPAALCHDGATRMRTAVFPPPAAVPPPLPTAASSPQRRPSPAWVKRESEKDRRGEIRERWWGGILHVGPTMSQPSRQIKPGWKPPNDLKYTVLLSWAMLWLRDDFVTDDKLRDLRCTFS